MPRHIKVAAAQMGPNNEGTPREAIVETCRTHPDVALGIIRVLARRVRTFAGLVKQLSAEDWQTVSVIDPEWYLVLYPFAYEAGTVRYAYTDWYRGDPQDHSWNYTIERLANVTVIAHNLAESPFNVALRTVYADCIEHRLDDREPRPTAFPVFKVHTAAYEVHWLENVRSQPIGQCIEELRPEGRAVRVKRGLEVVRRNCLRRDELRLEGTQVGEDANPLTGSDRLQIL